MTHPPTGNTGTISIGVPGIDTILRGGLTRDRLYLLEGMPGSGKTTIAMQFLTEGVAQGEKVLYVTLSETTGELLASAQSHGWTLEGIDIHEVLPSESALDPDEQYTIFHPTEVELGRTTQQIVEAVERVKPSRLVIDSLSELQLLAANSLRYRRQVLAFKQFFSTRACTVLLLDDRSTANGDLEVRSIAHGVLSLNQLNTDFGGTRPAHAGHQIPRRAVHRRHARLPDPARRRGGVPAPCRLERTHHRASAPVPHRRRNPRRAARRRHRGRHQHLAGRPAGHRQVVAGRADRGLGAGTGRPGRDVHLRGVDQQTSSTARTA
jgi:KaiC/GvpD/RAD55 family RecA-like ATPase